MLCGPMCCQTGQPETFDTCIGRSKEGGCVHPLPLLQAMKNNTSRRSGVGLSSSVLAMCPRQFVLQEKNDYYEDPKDFYQRWRGSFGHYAIEMGGPYDGVIQEVRFYRTIEVDGVTMEISGQPDWIDVDRGHMEDHKFVGWPPDSIKPDHEAQVNVYIWLVEGGYVGSCVFDTCFQWHPGEGESPLPKGFEVTSAKINYLHTRGYKDFNVPLWTNNAVEGYIIRKLAPHAEYYKTGNIAKLRIVDEADKWKAKYCPFRDPQNPGRCCMDQISDEGQQR